MATLHIDILNPKIDLITNTSSNGNDCKGIHTSDILTTKGASVTISLVKVNNYHREYDKFFVNNGNGNVEVTPPYTFTMNSTGKASFTIEQPNAGELELTNGGELLPDGSDDVNTNTQYVGNCNEVKVTVTDTTNGKTESNNYTRCYFAEKCPQAPTNPNPTPTTPKIDSSTNIRIYFDASGSMDDTLPALQRMRDFPLKAALQQYYGSETAYNSKVQIRSIGIRDGKMHPAYEDPYKMLNFENENLSGKVISLVFMNEADIFAASPFDKSATRFPAHDTSLSTFRGRLNSFPPNYYKGVLFQIDTDPYWDGSGFEDGDILAFRPYMEAVKLGQGSYTGVNGLSDKSEVNIKLDVTAGEDFKAGTQFTPQELEQAGLYYHNLVITSLQELGLDI